MGYRSELDDVLGQEDRNQPLFDKSAPVVRVVMHLKRLAQFVASLAHSGALQKHRHDPHSSPRCVSLEVGHLVDHHNGRGSASWHKI